MANGSFQEISIRAVAAETGVDSCQSPVTARHPRVNGSNGRKAVGLRDRHGRLFALSAASYLSQQRFTCRSSPALNATVPDVAQNICRYILSRIIFIYINIISY